MPPPSGVPPILLSLDYATEMTPPVPEVADDAVAYKDGQLRLVSNVPDGNRGIAADQTVFRDVIVIAQIALAEGGDEDIYGLFVRSPRPDLYYTFAVSPSGEVVISRFDGEWDPRVAGPLAPDMPFERGIGKSNRFSIVALGPSLTFLLNDTVITTEMVEEDCQEGYLGFYVHHGSTSPRAELAADWIQVRGIFPDPTEG